MVLAQKHGRVLLVDADLRRSGVSSSLGLHRRYGLSSCLAGAMDPAEAIAEAPGLPGVEILPAGPIPPDPVELLDSARMRELLMKWRSEYDHVVIDTPPLLGLADALVMSTMADMVVLVVRFSVTGKQTLARARDAMMRLGIRRLGIVFNDLDINSADHYSYYGYYGSRYGKYYTYSKDEK
jgi:capsular exopolysaccharide synthesis family protein